MDHEPDHGAGTDGCFPASPTAAANGSSEDDFDAVLAAQRQDWLTGRRTPVAERLRQDAALAADAARAAELVYHEYLLREELGESPDWEDYLRQFPQLASLLRLLHQADQLVEQTLGPAEAAAQSMPHVKDYELLEEIGRGGMAVVYRARQISLNRVVALKMILTGQLASAAEVARFHTEAEAVARLQHPNIVQIHAIGTHDGQPFLTLEYVDGGTLSNQLAGQPLPPRQAAQLAATLAQAIDHAHQRGIVHLDLKPANVLLESVSSPQRHKEHKESPSLCSLCLCGELTPKIADFGLARKWEEGVPAASHSGLIRGTPSYMAPEQADTDKKRAVGPRSDVYALGAILYEMLTGRPPFRAATPLETLEQVRTQEPVPPRQLQPKVARDLETICLKCLEKEPGRRYASAAELAADLECWLRGKPVRARRIGSLGRLGRWCRRQPAIAGLAAVLLVVVASGFATILVGASPRTTKPGP